MFDGTVFSELDLGSGKYDANFDANGKCSPDKTDNILGIEDIKRQVREEYNNSCEDDEDSSKPGGIEKANLRGLMRTSIRISILEAVSRGVFMGAIYSMEDMLKDPALVAFFVEMVKSDLLFQDSEYYEEFLVQAKVITDEKIKRGEKLLNPFNKEEDTKLIHLDDPKTQNGENSLRFIVREELKYLSSRIDERLRPQHKNIDNFFLQEMIPTVDVRRHYQQNIFHKPVFSKIADPDVEEVGEDIISDFLVKKEYSFIDKGSDLFGESGGFVLERYIRVEDSIENLGLDQQEIDAVQTWYNRPGGRDNQNPDLHPAAIVDIGNSSPSSYAYTSGAVNIEAFRDALAKLLEENPLPDNGIKLSKLISNLKFGLRLVYIPSLDDETSFAGSSSQITGTSGEDLVGKLPIYANPDTKSIYEQNLVSAFIDADQLLSEKNGFNQILDQEVTKGSNAFETHLDTIAKREKLFKVEEILGAFSTEEVESDLDVNLLLTQNVQVKRFYPVEIIKVEDDYGVVDMLKQNSGKTNLQELIDLLDDKTVIDTITTGLKQKMKEQKEYKFAFHYDIPIRRALSILFVHHNMTSIKNYRDITRTFSLSKDMLRSSFFNMIPGSLWWSKQDKRIEEQGGNAGMMETANNTMTMDGPSGSDIAKKIAIQAAIIITKALAAQQDPNYALMKKLDTFGLTLGGMSWKSVPVLYPVNFPLPFPPFMGWGPPMTPLGMIAYSLPFLPGEAKKNKNKEQNKQEENSEC